jgi:N,N'-diacetyllegionaminate synthase
MKFPEFLINAEQNLFIIAEAGVNHNGDFDTALRLVDAAVEAGCDAVKFQTWITEKVYSRERSVKPEYQKRTTCEDESEYDTIKQLELSYKDFARIKNYCDKKGILFFSTPDEEESADFLAHLGVGLMKTASQDVTNMPFLRYVAQLGMPVIFSTGACTLVELAEGVETILAETNELVILHCISSYPAPVEDMNLLLIQNLHKLFGCPVGLSDHSLGVEAACASVALGARVFEKHLTLDKAMKGPDHQASIEPAEMRHYCQTLRSIRVALGDGVKRVMPCEADTRKAFRRFIVAARYLPAGTVLSAQDVCLKKVVNGIAPRHFDMIIGSQLTESVAEDTPITVAMLNPLSVTLGTIKF